MKNDTVVLCPVCVPMSCCPTITKDNASFCIKDDYGSSIEISIDQAQDLIKKIDELSSLPRSSMDH